MSKILSAAVRGVLSAFTKKTTLTNETTVQSIHEIPPQERAPNRPPGSFKRTPFYGRRRNFGHPD